MYIFIFNFKEVVRIFFIFNDINFYLNGFLKNMNQTNILYTKFLLLFKSLNDKRKYIFKKYVYTINHKRIAINYFFFSM
jgi:hypothetical protein